jgi:hypothetical protein
MAVGTKLTGKFGELWWNAKKVTLASDIKLGAMASEINADDHDSGGYSDTFAGIVKTTCTANCFYSDGDTDQAAIRAAAGLDATEVIEYRPNGTASGKTKFASNARVLGWSMGAPVGGMQTIDITFGVKGAWVEGVQA